MNPADQPVLYLALSSSTLPLSTVDEYGETLMAQRISMVDGVAQVQVFGPQKYAVRIQLDPKALASRGLGINEVGEAVKSQNVNLPTGTLYGTHKAVTVQATGQLTTAEAYRPMIVAYRGGQPVRLGDLGQVINGVENNKIASWYKNSRAIVLAIQRQPGTNTIQVVDSIKKLLPTLRSQIPASVNIDTLYDRSATIRESVNDVQFTLLLALGLVVLVIFLFLRNLSATVIPSLALPMSIVGTFSVMYMLGYSLDNLSLMALILAVGFVVDDAIVVLENIVRHMEMGEKPFEAALKGSREIGFTILSMTLSLAAVFIPVFFMGGILGRLLHEFAVTIVAAILVSGLVSLTLTPMLCSRFLKPPREEHHGRLYMLTERFFDGLLRLYDSTLQRVLRHRRATMMVSGLLLVVTFVLFAIVPKGFLPSEDTGSIFAFTEAAEGISFDAMVQEQKALSAIVAKNPYVDNWMSSMGAGGINVAGNTGRLFIRLIPRKKRPGVDEIIQQLRSQLSVVPGIRVYPQNLPPIRIGGMLTKGLYQLTLQSPDTGELYKYAPLLQEKMRSLPGLVDVNSDLQIKNPQVNVLINRDKAATLGVSAQQIEDALYYAYGSRQISTIYAPNNEYQVIMELDPRYQMDPAALPLLYVRSNSGQLVPLDALANLTQTLGPLTINHAGQLPAVTISFNLKPGMALGDAVAAVQKRGPADAAGHYHHQLPGRGPGLPGVHARPVALADHVHPGHLHDPGHPVRKLHPPRDYPVGSAFGRGGGPGGPLALSPGPGYLWLCGDYHAGGHRQEKRHHDDRLRPGSPAHRGQKPPGGDLLRGPGPLPAHHDDHHGGPHGGAAHRPGIGRRGRIPPDPGYLGGGRPPGLPAPHPLHHPGLLPLYGILPEKGGQALEAAAPGERGTARQLKSPGLNRHYPGHFIANAKIRICFDISSNYRCYVILHVERSDRGNRRAGKRSASRL